MRMDNSNLLDAKTVVNSYTKEKLDKIFKEYGEIKYYETITKQIMEYRKNKRIESAKELSSIFEVSKPSRIHPATLIFQAIRIEVNNELEELKMFLDHLDNLKKTRIAIISFHSLEDKIIKNKFRFLAQDCICDKNIMKCQCGGNQSKGRVITKRPIVPSEYEIKVNYRARSAKMRCFKFND